MTEITRALPSDAGCWIDGHWGQYAVARMVEIAESCGYVDDQIIDIADRHLASMAYSREPITDEEHEILSDACDEVEAWLNEHVAPEGFYFGWYEGEFYLSAEGDDDEEWAGELDDEPEVVECEIHVGRAHATGSYACEIYAGECWAGTE